jgi:TonB family protein
MQHHGIDPYHREWRRFERRLGGTIVAVAITLVALLNGFAVWKHTRAGRETLASIPVRRWGYEGPDQLVRRIELKTDEGASHSHPGPTAEYVPAAHKGGSKRIARRIHENAPPVTRPPQDIEGDSDVDRLARARARLLNVPLVRSEDLIIDRLVRPLYPDEARDHNIEGHVAVLALVDTTGAIASVEVVGTSEGGLLERASEEAVWKCRFRPYKVNGQTQSVYALFRFAFHIY